MSALPLHGSTQRDAVIAAYESRAELMRKQTRRVRRGNGGDGIVGDGGGVSGSFGGTWRQFEAVGEVLHKFGALEDWVATDFGNLVMELGTSPAISRLLPPSPAFSHLFWVLSSWS